MVTFMMNEYHKQFLRLLDRRNVRFLVIGGQARFAHQGAPTSDLDLWVDISHASRAGLEQCLLEWKRMYPAHTLADLTPPLLLRPNLQIKFPDADCFYKQADGQMAEITPRDGIDILTSIGDADFDTYFERAVTMTMDGPNIRVLAASDVEGISPLKEK
jgi:hypothetical protein